MNELLVVDLGLVEYGAAWELQRRLVAARKAGGVPDVLLLCEHPHVITLGRSGKLANLRASDSVLRQMGVSFFETNRGGDITYHGPGQLVGYPILNLSEIRRDVGWYVRSLEEAMIRASAEFGISGRRVPGRTGVWVDVRAEERNEVKDVERGSPCRLPFVPLCNPDSDVEALSARLASRRGADRDAQPGDGLASPKNRRGGGSK